MRLFLILLLLAKTPSNANLASNMAQYTELSGKMLANGGKFLKQLKFITEKTADLMELAGPAGCMASAFIKMTFDVGKDSDELKAITALHQLVKAEFEALNKKIVVFGKEIKEHDSEGWYMANVAKHLLILQHAREHVVNPNIDREVFLDQFVNACADHNGGPNGILASLETQFMTMCPLAATLDREMDIIEAIEDFGEQHAVTFHAGAAKQARRDMLMNYKSGSLNANLLIWQLRTGRFSMADVSIQGGFNATTFLSELARENLQRSSANGCYLQIAADDDDLTKKNLNKVLGRFNRDLVYTSMFSMECYNFTAPSPTPQKMWTFGNETAKRIQNLGNHVIQYLENARHESWTHDAIAAAKEVIGQDKISNDQYQQLALRIHNRLKALPREREIYYVVVTEPAMEYVFTWTTAFAKLATPYNSYACITDIEGASIHIFRYESVVKYRRFRANEYISHGERRRLIEDLLKQENTITDVQTTMKDLLHHYSGILSELSFHSAFLVRKTSNFGNPNLRWAQSGDNLEIGGEKINGVIRALYNDGFIWERNCEHVLLFVL